MNIMTMNKKKFIVDVVLNLVASTVVFAVLQFFALPFIARNVDANHYGLVVTYISMFNLVSASFGNVLNNIRLINEKNDWKSYNLELLILAILNIAVISGFSFYYDNTNYSQIILNIGVGSLWLLKEYLIVAFRITINYRQILISNVIQALGHVVGLACFFYSGTWQYVYIIGFSFCIIYISCKTNIWKERIKKTTDFGVLSFQTMQLLMATLFYRVPIYADKMIIYPLLGARDTSILYIATLSGKVIAAATTPLSGVMLSYLARRSRKSKSVFRGTLIVGSIIGAFGYLLCLVISFPLLSIIYPDYANDVMKYIPIATATAIVTGLVGIVNPFLISYFNMKWQIIIGVIYVALYSLLTVSLLLNFALYGFCVGALVAESIRLIISIVVFSVFKEKNETKELIP